MPKCNKTRARAHRCAVPLECPLALALALALVPLECPTDFKEILHSNVLYAVPLECPLAVVLALALALALALVPLECPPDGRLVGCQKESTSGQLALNTIEPGK